MDTGANVGICPICGGSLQAAGGDVWRCTRCRAQVRIEVLAGPVGDAHAGRGRLAAPGAAFSLVPADLSLGTDVPFIDLILVKLGYGPTYGLSAEPAVRSFVQATPGLYESIRTLGAAVGAAGVRVRDGGLLAGSFDDDLKYYSAPEIWCFDLALDVLGLLADVPEVSPREQFSTRSALKDLEGMSHHHAWKKAMKQVGDDAPAGLRELRALMPHRAQRGTRGRLRPTRGDDVRWL